MKIIVNNLAVEYEDTGKGPVMLLLHGWKQSHRTFDALVPLLSTSFRLILLGLPGFGGPELPREAWGTGEYASFVADFCKKLEVSPEVIVGHSFGGRIMLKGVAEGVIAPKQLVLIASAGLATHRTVKARLFLVISKLGRILLFFFPRSAKESLRRKLYGAAGSSDYINIDSPVLKATFLKAIREDLSHCAKKVGVPTLLIWGRQDVTTPLWQGKRLHDLISGSQLEVIEGAGHFVHQERAGEVAERIREFTSQ